MRVIVADDEMHVRRFLERRVDWKALGVEDLVLCDDGEEILERMEEEPADILLTDIRMARMGGIEAAKEARKKWPKLAVILISAYDDKEYLKSALDLQVVGYLEKPFTAEAAEELLKRAAADVRDSRAGHQAVEDAARRQLRLKKAELAGALCRIGADADKAWRELDRLYPEFAAGQSFCAVLFQMERGEEEQTGFSSEPEAPWERFAGFFEDTPVPAVCTGLKRGGVCAILAAESGALRPLAEELLVRLGEYGLGAYARIAVGTAADRRSVRDSYREAAVTMERHFYHAVPILYAKDGLADARPVDLAGTEETFRTLLANGSAKELADWLCRLREELLAHDVTLVQNVKKLYFRLALLLLKKDRSEQVSEYYLWELFNRTNTLEELHRSALDLLKTVMPDGAKGQEEPIEEMLAYIHASLRDPELSLASLSRRFYMSVTWLCIYFKEKTGTTVKSYVIDCRMKEAARLLTWTDLKVSAVAEAVGFPDQGYFTKSFGRYYGMSPSRYKEENRAKTE